MQFNYILTVRHRKGVSDIRRPSKDINYTHHYRVRVCAKLFKLKRERKRAVLRSSTIIWAQYWFQLGTEYTRKQCSSKWIRFKARSIKSCGYKMIIDILVYMEQQCIHWKLSLLNHTNCQLPTNYITSSETKTASEFWTTDKPDQVLLFIWSILHLCFLSVFFFVFLKQWCQIVSLWLSAFNMYNLFHVRKT